MKEALRSAAYIVLLFSFLVASFAMAPSSAQVVHEDPGNLTSIKQVDMDYRILMAMADMFNSMEQIASCLNSSDFNGARLNYDRLSGSYDSFKALIERLDMTDTEYGDIVNIGDLAMEDIRTLVFESENYSVYYEKYEEALRDDDRDAYIAYAVSLQETYREISEANRNVWENVTAIKESAENMGHDVNRLYSDFLLVLDDYHGKLEEREKPIDVLLGGTRLEISSDKKELSVGDDVRLDAVLTDKDGLPVSGSKVSFYVENRLAGTAVTDPSGRCYVVYRIPLTIFKSNIKAYSEFRPEKEALSPSISDVLELNVSEESTALSINVYPSNASYGDTVTVSGMLCTEEGAGIFGKPVRIFLNGVPYGPVRTAEDGSYVYSLNIGPYTPGGTCEIYSEYTRSYSDDILLGSTSRYASLDVSMQDSILTLGDPDDIFTGGDDARFEGVLKTFSGLPVSGAKVKIYADGVVTGTGTTDNDGRYVVQASIPYNILPGTQQIYSEFSPGPNTAVHGSKSDVCEAIFKVSDPAVMFDGMPLVLFPEDTLTVNGTLQNYDGKAIPGKPLNVSFSGIVIGTTVTDGEGKFNVSYAVSGGDISGIGRVEVFLDDDGGLLSGGVYNGGFLLVMPVGKAQAAILFIIVLAVVIAAAAWFGGLRRHMRDRSRVVKPAVLEPLPEPVSTEVLTTSGYDFDKSVADITRHIESGDYRGSIKLIYEAVKMLAGKYGLETPDSATHREFYRHVVQKDMSLEEPLKPIISRYEVVSYGEGDISEDEAYRALDGLRTINILMGSVSEDTE
ncbi:hypothetical protein CUJ83_07735 [Methanocella sp. CWC-04]|uniref:Protein-glutamine gamma-glutamyltransferase-like C-terminal domain-containing protein n=1 Tax=Methanooceanicella nereidis TaxID=2052831 RepID=A0AAP2RET7_9EURY|nr:DUF4129 domain-containing protein [Methanocella sp. CWC-04]MCD1294887.1 hypothetical protein [Methanocella sp. CWC-04]